MYFGGSRLIPVGSCQNGEKLSAFMEMRPSDGIIHPLLQRHLSKSPDKIPLSLKLKASLPVDIMP